MTNKKVIIDKVNVSGCEYLYTDSRYNDKCCSASIGGDCLCKPSEMLCVKYVEHLKEQLKCKEQECEGLKQTLTEIKEITEPFCETCQKVEPEKKDRNNIYCRFCNYGKILQKISECGVKNEN